MYANTMFYVKLLTTIPQKVVNLSYTFDEANNVYVLQDPPCIVRALDSPCNFS